MKKALALLLLMTILTSCGVPSAEPAAPAADPSAEPPQQSQAAPAQEPAPAEATGQKLIYADVSEPISLDPHIGNDAVTCTALALANQGLLDSVSGEIMPGLAESFTISDDGTVYTFNLRDAKWSDGVPVTAQQFVDTYVRMLTRQDAMDLAYNIFPIKNAQAINEGTADASTLGCRAIDDKTLEITLEGPYPFMQAQFACSPFYPIRVDLAEEYGPDYGNSADKIVSCGPYILKEWAHGDRMVFTKNPDFWNADKVNIDEVTMLLIKDTNTLKNMYDTGEIDFLSIPEEQLSAFEGQPGFSYYSAGRVLFLCFSHKGTNPETAKAIQNRDFITALSLAIDREGFVKALFPANSPFTAIINPEIADQTGGKWKDTYPEENPYHQLKPDLEKAKEHMQKACEALGYASAADIPALEFITIEGELNRTTCEYFQNVWEQAFGLKTEIIPLAYAQYWDNLYGAPYDVARSGWGPDYDDPFTYMDMWDSRGGWNKTGWSSDEYNNLMTSANQQTDMKKRNELFYQAEQILLSEAPVIPMMLYQKGYIINHDKIEGIATNLFGPTFDFRYAKVK